MPAAIQHFCRFGFANSARLARSAWVRFCFECFVCDVNRASLHFPAYDARRHLPSRLIYTRIKAQSIPGPSGRVARKNLGKGTVVPVPGFSRKNNQKSQAPSPSPCFCRSIWFPALLTGSQQKSVFSLYPTLYFCPHLSPEPYCPTQSRPYCRESKHSLGRKHNPMQYL